MYIPFRRTISVESACKCSKYSRDITCVDFNGNIVILIVVLLI